MFFILNFVFYNNVYITNIIFIFLIDLKNNKQCHLFYIVISNLEKIIYLEEIENKDEGNDLNEDIITYYFIF